MDKPNSTMSRQIAQAASVFEQQRTGNTPKSVTVVLSDTTLVITLHGALSPAEKALAKSPAGAAQVQEFHRQLFANASESLRQEIKRITGVEVREATAEVEPTTGTVVGVFTTGTTVQVYLLAHSVPAETWSGSGNGDPESKHEAPQQSGVGKVPRRQISADEARQVGAGLGLDWAKVDLAQFRRGLEVELEHGARDLETNVTNDDLVVTGKIAWAHLKELPDYYTRLDRLETEGDAYWTSRPQTPTALSASKELR